MLSLVRSYTYNFPIDKGKGRVFKLAKKLAGPRNVITETKDGRLMAVGFRDWAEDLIYFMGTYESFATKVIKEYVQPGRSVCLDVGANIGWYTTLFQSLGAEVHSFEPAPKAFERLKRNVELNYNRELVHLNNFGLGSEMSTVDLHIPDDEPEGHATLADIPGSTTTRIEIRTLDSYLIEKGVDKVDVVKVDIEGSELAFLKGAARLFNQFVPPIMLIEMSAGVAARSGYTTNDLITFLRPYYELFEVDEKRRELIPVGDSVNANVLCIPK